MIIREIVTLAHSQFPQLFWRKGPRAAGRREGAPLPGGDVKARAGAGRALHHPGYCVQVHVLLRQHIPVRYLQFVREERWAVMGKEEISFFR